MTNDMQLSIVVVNWNAKDFIRECLASIEANPPSEAFEILVIDNDSSDGSVETIRAAFPQVHMVENPQNVGFARANNIGLERSRGEYLLLLNPDTVIVDGVLNVLIQHMKLNPKTGAAGPRLENPEGNLLMSCHPDPSLAREFWRLFHLDRLIPMARYEMEAWNPGIAREVDVIQGACLMLRREALEQVGLMDEDYFIYSEEVDLCHRLRQSDWGIKWVPGAKVVHYEGRSTRIIPDRMFIQLYRGKITYFRKRKGWLTAETYKLILLAASIARLMLSPLALLEDGRNRKRHLRLAARYRRLITEMPGM